MNRSLLLCVSILLFAALSSHGFAQNVPNGGFENWTNGNPDGWFANNMTGLAVPVTKSATGHSGSASLRGEVVSMSVAAAIPYAPTLQSGTTANGFSWTQRSASFTAYYQFTSVAGKGDRLAFNVILVKGTVASGAVVASAAATISSNATSWTQLSIPFTYVSNDAPTTCYIQMLTIGPTENASPTIGTFFLVDDLNLSGTAPATAVENPGLSTPTSFALEQNYPNPFNPSTKINFSVAQPGYVALKVYTLLGTEVATLVNEQKGVGSFSVNWNATGLPSGMYMYRLSVASAKGVLFDQSKKLMLLK
jgi:hypothetical protein